MNPDLFPYEKRAVCPSKIPDNILHRDRIGCSTKSTDGQQAREISLCSVFPPKSSKLNQGAGFKSDVCKYSADEYMSVYPGNYNVSNFYDCSCVPENPMNFMIENPSIAFNNGYGWVGQGGCAVDYDSKARLGQKLTNVRCKKQLFTRLALTKPYMGRGIGDICVENELQEGEDTGQKKQCNNLAGVYVDTFVPLVPCLQHNVQNPIHIIPEDNNPNWIWGGIPSRQYMKMPCCYPCNKR